MSSAREEGGANDWERFRRRPSTIAHPEVLAELFDGAVDPETALAIGRSERLSARVSALLVRRLSISDAEPAEDEADVAIALASAERLEELRRQAGAVCWADAIAREIRSAEVAQLRERLGEDAYAAALANRDQAISRDEPEVELAEGETPPEPKAPPTLDELVEAVERDGRGCLAAWLAVQKPGIARRVRLRLPAGERVSEPDEALREAGPRIFRRLAA